MLNNAFFTTRSILLLLGITATAGFIGSAATAQTTFPDVPANYWARPFIENLAQRDIIAGYPDGTYRPEQAVERDEFAAIIRKAFNQDHERQIASGSVFNDVPKGYWAAPAIEEAYETGFMNAPGGNFRPTDDIARSQALVVLVRGLNLAPARPQATTQQATRAKRPLYFPVAIASLMQPVFKVASATAANNTTPPATQQQIALKRPASAIVNQYYTDANQIPQDAVNAVALATQENVVVNYPNPKVLNPNAPLNRATAAAWVHQALVREGRIPPLGNNSAANYIVGRTGSNL